MSITVLGYDGKSVYPLRNSADIDREHNIALMLIEQDGVNHYCLVKNPGRLLASQVSKHDGKHNFCLNCLNPFWCQGALIKHQQYCGKKEAIKIEMPKLGTMMEFKDYYKSEKVPFIVYADFECFIKPIESCEPNPENSYTKNIRNTNRLAFAIT